MITLEQQRRLDKWLTYRRPYIAYVKRDANSGARCVAARVYNNEKLYLKVKNEVAEYLKRFFYR
jgi:hypothetical protein